MVILVLAIVLALCWLFVKRMGPLDPALRRAGVAVAVAGIAVALALRAGPVGIALLLGAIPPLVVWWSRRGGDDGGPGDDGPPDDAGPDPGPQAGLRLDRDALDRARAEWEQELRARRS